MSTPSRRGSALFVTMITVGLIAFLMLQATTTVESRADEIALVQAQEQAIYAAEAVAALKESELADFAARNELELLGTMGTVPLGQPYDLNGDGDTNDPGEQMIDLNGDGDGNDVGEDPGPMAWQGDEIHFGNCRVRWRIEPLAITNGTDYSVNPAYDPSTVAPPASIDVDGDMDGDTAAEDYASNVDFYNYRIATEAYYLPDPGTLEDPANPPDPWRSSSNRLAVAQASRTVQLRLDAVFKYALFYAAVGPEGDIEFHNGPNMRIMGAVHSNGAIYFGGDGNQSVSYTNRQGNSETRNVSYPPGTNGDVDIGSNSERKSVVAVNGLFCIQKYPMYEAVMTQLLPDAVEHLDPYNLPLPGNDYSEFDTTLTTASPMSGSEQVNASNSNTYQINGVSINAGDNDSRSPSAMDAVPEWSGLVLDGNRGASVVRTLSNIPELGGRPFEPVRLVGVERAPASLNNQLWVRDPRNADFTLTVLPNDPPAPYYFDPFAERTDRLLDENGNNAYATIADDDYAFVPDAAPDAVESSARNDVEYEVIGQHPDDHPTTANPDEIGRARPLYYAQDPTTLDTRDLSASDIVPIGTAYDESPGQPGRIPGLPVFIQTKATDWPVDAGGMARFTQVDLDGDTLHLLPTRNPLSDVTDPLRNRYDSGRSWYDPGEAFSKRITDVAQTSDGSNPQLDRDGTGDEQDEFARNEFLGVYHGFGLAGGNGQDPGFGLVIRERPQQLTDLIDTSDGITTSTRPRRGDYPDDASYLQAKVDYLASQYVVYFGTYLDGSDVVRRDITEVFFGYNLGAASDDDDLVAHEDWVRNRRETGFNGWLFDVDGGHGIDLDDFKVNWLTLNVDVVCDFIRTTTLDQIQPGGSATDTVADGFNGMIYVARTRRSEDPLPEPVADLHGLADHYVTSSDPTGRLPHGYHPIWHPDWKPPLDPSVLEYTWDNGDYSPPAHNFDMEHSDAATAQQARIAAAAVRTGNGPDTTFNSAVRFAQGEAIFWGGYLTPDGAGSPTRTRGLTLITPNPAFIEGDFNTTLYDTADPPNTSSFTALTGGNDLVSDSEYENRPAGFELPPCAVFTDSLSVLSNNWDDSNQTQFDNNPTGANDTWYNTSVITNNVPTYLIDAMTDVVPSGGPHNLIRFLENWNGDWWHIRGSVVVMGVSKYSRAEAGWSGNNRTSGNRYYNPPQRDITFNTDLFSRAGQPPFTPFGVRVVRTVQTINLSD